MTDFVLLAAPIWINLLLVIPVFLFYYWHKHKLSISSHTLINVSIFGIAFGFVEASVVIYLRAAIGFLPGFEGSLSDIQRLSVEFYNQPIAAQQLPPSLLTVEVLREAATLVMLASIAIMSANKFKERFALYLLAFSFWDIFYYFFLFLLVRWPSSFTTYDVLFLIPQPWISQVWFPILISLLTIFAVFLNRKIKNSTQ